MVFQTVIGGYRSLELVSWANGTPAQIAAMLDAHYEGRINLANYWSVGDARTVGLDAIEANDCTDAMSAQTAQLVLMNAGGKTLVNPINGRTTCAFVVGFKECLTKVGKYNTGSTGRYSTSTIRQFLNNQLFLSMPSEIRGILKSFVNTTYEPSPSSNVNTEDLLALPALVEVATSSYGKPAEGSLFTYYNTTSNRIKRMNGSAAEYWTRSFENYDSPYTVNTSGNYSYTNSATATRSISPFGVI